MLDMGCWMMDRFAIGWGILEGGHYRITFYLVAQNQILVSDTLKLTEQSRLINLLIKLIFLVLMALVIYYQVFRKENIGEIWGMFVENLGSQPVIWLILPLLLMPVNWGLETEKWRKLIHSFAPLSFGRAFQAILAGVTFSLFTPNRIGEYGGRILFVEAQYNWRAVIATLVGSYGQLLVLLSGGILGLTYFGGTYFELQALVVRGIFFLGVAFAALLVFCFYNIDLVIPLIKRVPYIRRFSKPVEVLRKLTRSTLNQVLSLSTLRYLVYSLQYYFLLRYFGIEVNIFDGLAGIATIFLLQTSIPLPPLMGLIARGEIALLVWGNFSENELGILAVTFILWIINLIIPALIGTIFITNINVLKTLGYEKKRD